MPNALRRASVPVVASRPRLSYPGTVTGSLALDVLVFLYALVLPGLLAARVVLGDKDPVVWIPTGLVIGPFCIPVIDYSLAVLLRTHISPALVLGVSSALLVGIGAVHLRARRQATLAR